MVKSYFLVSVSTKENLNLCIKHALAGFPSSRNGLWTFVEINEGDYISFLFGAEIHNLYKVKKKIATKNAGNLLPWKPLIIGNRKMTYSFPYRLELEPVRKLHESLVKVEFSYVAENLLLRGGYRKTHFQADQTTLQNVSKRGVIYENGIEKLNLDYEIFVPKFTLSKENQGEEIFKLQEIILQSAIRQNIAKVDKMKEFLDILNIKNLEPKSLEVLGEKAIPQGHIDILIKEAIPIGQSKNLVVEVKLNKASKNDFDQVEIYINELGKECIGGILIARSFPKKLINKLQNSNIKLVEYSLKKLEELKSFTFDELKDNIEYRIV